MQTLRIRTEFLPAPLKGPAPWGGSTLPSSALRTIVPFKKPLLEPREFFGAHACDIHALMITDLMVTRAYDPCISCSVHVVRS